MDFPFLRVHLATRVACLTFLLATTAPAWGSFVTFESGQVRPLALSPDGTRLFAVNTPDNRLETFTVDAGGALAHEGSLPVGMEPVAVAARNDAEVWVVNHLSDSVSVVDVSSVPPRVVRTLLVGDEPRDIVFAGPGNGRAFVTAAHRGQNRPGDPQLTTEGVGRADVWVFDATNLGATLEGTPLTIITLLGDTPRALARTADGSTVLAAVFHSGNRTTTLNMGLVCDGGSGAGPCSVAGSTMPGGLPPPDTNVFGAPRPEVGLIVRFDGANWLDELGRIWNDAVRFTLPDRDVFAIDADADPPAAIPGAVAPGVGTVIFNMAVNPVSNRVYVSNTEARNEVRFEGPGVFADTTVRGHLHEARITVLDTSGVHPRHLNKHLNYNVVPSPGGVKDHSLATPTGLAVTNDGATLYVAALGSSKVGVFSTAQLEADTFVPEAATHIPVTGGGPTGLVLNAANTRLYVFTRFDNAVSVVDTATGDELAHLPLHNPEPASVVAGRPFLYDALLTSSNGEASCAACHVFGDFDSLAWDLGNPDEPTLDNLNPMLPGLPGDPDFHPMKGPMTTQSLRGMANHGPMHWRGDRTGGLDEPSVQPNGGAFDEDLAFEKFNPAFSGLLGRTGPLTATQMQAFTDFILQVTYPPNPIRALDNSLDGNQTAGRSFYFNSNPSDTIGTCNFCHVLNPGAGFFGSDGRSVIEPQTVKVPHLRNAYQKVGMFGMHAVPTGLLAINPGNNGNLGEQVRGFGFAHDGSFDTLFRFFNAVGFNQSGGNLGGFSIDLQRRQMEAFMLAFDSDLAPIVGQQTTLTAMNAAAVGGRIDLMIARDVAGECEVTVKGVLGGEARGWLRTAAGTFQSDRATQAPISDTALRAHAAIAGQERTYTCVPPGSGQQIGLDRDGDGFFDRDELDAGSDPADPGDVPGGAPTTTTTTSTTSSTTTTMPGVTSVRSTSLTLRDDNVPPIALTTRKVVFKSSTRSEPAGNRIVLPAGGSLGDPTVHGAVLAVYNASGSTSDAVILFLPPSGPLIGQGWKRIGAIGAPSVYRYTGKDPNGPITSIAVKPDSIVVRGGRANWSYTLDEPSQGRVAVRLILGETAHWCAEAPAKVTGNPPSTAQSDRVDRFIGQPKAPPPAVCPPLPGG